MIASKNAGGDGQDVPGWFKTFLVEYRADREFDQRRWDQTGGAIKTLAESVQHLAEEVRDLSARFHQFQKETNDRLGRVERELARTREQSAKLFRRLIGEVKALRPRR